MTIPKIMHRMWLDAKNKSTAIFPQFYNKHAETFEKYNQDFDIYFWNMDNVELLFQSYPELQKYYHIWSNMPHHIQKCDFARYAIMYIFGGVYADLDFVYYRNISPLLDRELLLVLEPPEHSYYEDIDAKLFNGFIGSVPNHRFWLDWMDYIILSLKKTSDVMETTGPSNFRKWFNISDYRNTELADTCDLLPIYHVGDDPSPKLTKQCADRLGTNVFKKNYHEKLGNYTDTKWTEGTGWTPDTRVIESFSQGVHSPIYYLMMFFAILILCIIIFTVFRHEINALG